MNNSKDKDPHDFRETLYTIDKRGNRRWVYNAIVKGRFFTRRNIVMTALMLFYLSMPWIVINGEQAIQFDIIGRRFVVLGSVFWATDTIFLFLILIILALSLFFVTAIVGRTWCGWACPETVFLDFLFRPIERLIEGSPAERLRLDQGPWNFRKLRIKSVKYAAFTFLSWGVASTFLAYFLGRQPLLEMMSASPLLHPGPFSLTLAMMGVMLFQFGWFREQFCTIICPYARFQSVMMDANSMTVGYDAKRGEPRGHKKASDLGLGDCVDCGLCVKVCPTGIDIRNGLQLECVACASCIDACDSVMLKLGRAPGLVRYDTEHGLAGERTTFLRPRVVVYAAILLVLTGLLSFRLTHRNHLNGQIVRGASDVPFSELAGGRVVNHLHLRLANNSKTSATMGVSLVALKDSSAELKLVMPVNPFPIPAESLQTAPVFVEFPASILHDGKRKINFKLSGSDGIERITEFTLLGPDNPISDKSATKQNKP